MLAALCVSALHFVKLLLWSDKQLLSVFYAVNVTHYSVRIFFKSDNFGNGELNFDAVKGSMGLKGWDPLQ